MMDSIKENGWTATWSGGYPNLCSGEWALFRDGVQVETHIPFQGEPADTLGEYQSWHFEDWIEVFDSYEDGLDMEDWVEKHRPWLSSFAEEAEFGAIYAAFNASDWRHGECGGCI